MKRPLLSRGNSNKNSGSSGDGTKLEIVVKLGRRQTVEHLPGLEAPPNSGKDQKCREKVSDLERTGVEKLLAKAILNQKETWVKRPYMGKDGD